MSEKLNAELEEVQRGEDLKKLLAEPWGRRIAWRLRTAAGVDEEPMTGNSYTFHKVGRQSVIREFFSELRAINRENYLLMFDENEGKR